MSQRQVKAPVEKESLSGPIHQAALLMGCVSIFLGGGLFFFEKFWMGASVLIVAPLFIILGPLQKKLRAESFRRWQEVDQKNAEIKRIGALERQAALGELVSRVTHDLRTPLSALQSVLQEAEFKDPSDQELGKMALGGLEEIISSLVKDYRVADSRRPVPLYSVVSRVVQSLNLKLETSGLVEAPLVSYVMAQEAVLEKKVREFLLSATQAGAAGLKVKIKVDSGVAAVLVCSEESGERELKRSELVLCEAPDWAFSKITGIEAEKRELWIVDDDPTQAPKWRKRLKRDGVSFREVRVFSSLDLVQAALNESLSPAFTALPTLILDYYFEGDSRNGGQWIEKYRSRFGDVYLITSAWQDTAIQDRAQVLGLKLGSKEWADCVRFAD